MPQILPIAVSDLILDPENARLLNEQPNQQATLIALTNLEGREMLAQAVDIVENGMDPLALLGVVAAPRNPGRYVVIEGNRRILALKALENPSLVTPGLGKPARRQIEKLAETFATRPIRTVMCALFDSERELAHWVRLRHTGANNGVGLVSWGPREQDRWRRRHAEGAGKPEGQILDFVEKVGALSEAARQSKKKIFTNLGRVISNRENRRRLGIDFDGNQVVMLHPADRVARSLTRVVEDLLTGGIKVKDIYDKEQQTEYVKSLGEDLPDPSSRLSAPQPLSSQGVKSSGKGKKSAQNPKTKNSTARAALIPKSFRPAITHARLQHLYHELTTLQVDAYYNSAAVMLRVFVELTLALYIEKMDLIPEGKRRDTILAQKLKVTADHLCDATKISTLLKETIHAVADNKKDRALAASVPTFNRYVHNVHAFPKSHELKIAWDELEPFMEAVFVDMA